MAKIIFVDKNDNVIGAGTKQEAWRKGIIHRITRVFLFNSKGELLIQKRADNLTSLPGKWDQSSAGHVDEGEDYLIAAKRELEEEIGVRGIELEEIKKFYTDEIDEAKIKKRFNMLYSAIYDGEVRFNKEEVSEVKWIKPLELEGWMEEQPEKFTHGFIKSFKLIRQIPPKSNTDRDGSGLNFPSPLK